jgi:hypothetical protein
MPQCGVERLAQIERAVERLRQLVKRGQFGDTLLGVGQCGNSDKRLTMIDER